MATTTGVTRIPRTADAIRDTLAEHCPQLCEQFAAEFHGALAQTDDDFDTARLDRLIGRWWAQAVVLLNPDPEADAAWQRLQAGDDSSLVTEWRPQPDGSQHVYHRTTTGDWAFAHVLTPQPA